MKKNLKWRCVSPAIRKTLLIMKLSLILFFAFSLQLSASVLLGQQVSIRTGESSLKSVLEELKEQTGIYFMYNEKDMDDSILVDLDMQNVSLEKTLEEICKQTPLEYEIIEDFVVFTKEAPVKVKGEVKQEKKVIQGTVTDEDGNTLPGVSIVVKGTTNGSATDIDGNYTIGIEGSSAVLVFSFVGMISQKISYTGQNLQNVTLKADSEQMDEVVVTGYQTISRERTTGSFDVVSGKIFNDRPNADIASSLEGVVAGFQRVKKTNPDGSISYNLRIRGQGTLTDGIANPLIVIDGFSVDDDSFSTIDPNTVESVTILKDASAASIWGARAANGVVVIVTKSGSKNKSFEVKVNAFTRITSDVDLDYINPIANTATQLDWEKYVYDNGLTGNLTPSSIGEVQTSLSPSLTLYNEYQLGNVTEADYNSQMANLKSYNYQDDVNKYLLRQNIYQQYNVSVAGSTERNRYSFSALYDKTKSQYVGDNTEKILLSLKDDFQIRDWLKFHVGATVRLQSDENNGASLTDIKGIPSYQRLVDDDGNYVPMVKDYYLPILDKASASGNFPYNDWNYNLLQETRSRDRQTDLNTIRLQGGLNIKIIEGLTWDTKIQYEKIDSKTKNVYTEESYLVRNQVNRYNQYDPITGKVTSLAGVGYAYPQGSALDRSSIDKTNYVFRNQLQYDKQFAEKHHILFLAGSEISSYVSNSNVDVRVWGYDDDKLLYGNQPFYNDYGARQFYTTSKTRLYPGTNWSSMYTDKRFFSLFGNFSYSYNNKYTFTASVRTDASNMIVDDPKYRYAPFWSVGAKWNLAKENFIKDIEWIDNLQLRGSYGYSGNVVTNTSIVPLISYSSSPSSYTQQYDASVKDFGNPLLRWEKTATFNLGVDFALFKNKLSGKIDVYSKQSKDILANIDIAGAYGLGYSNAVNAAEISNKGIEIELSNRQQITNDLAWKGRAVLAYNNNEVKSLDVNSYYPANLTTTNVFVKGRPLAPVYSYIYEGEENGIPMVTFENGQSTEIFNIPTVADARSFMQYEGSYIPSTELGFSNTFEYKGFTLLAMITGRFGHVFRAEAPLYPLMNKQTSLRLPMEDVVNGTSDKFPGLPAGDVSNLSAYSIVKYFNTLIEDASNIRMKEITLSYNIPQKVMKSLNISNVRVYTQVNNVGILWKATDTYYDPDYPAFKVPQSYLIGLNVTF